MKKMGLLALALVLLVFNTCLAAEVTAKKQIMLFYRATPEFYTCLDLRGDKEKSTRNLENRLKLAYGNRFEVAGIKQLGLDEKHTAQAYQAMAGDKVPYITTLKFIRVDADKCQYKDDKGVTQTAVVPYVGVLVVEDTVQGQQLYGTSYPMGWFYSEQYFKNPAAYESEIDPAYLGDCLKQAVERLGVAEYKEVDAVKNPEMYREIKYRYEGNLKAVEQMHHDRENQLPYLGIEVLPDAKGMLVTNVVKGEPGDKAGIIQGEVIVAVDGVTLTSAEHFVELIGKHKAGDRVKLALLGKNGKQQEKTIVSEKRTRAKILLTEA